MRILHTSDWHLGLKLHKIDLNDQARLFIDWLIDFTGQNDIDCVIHAGDIFDTKYPPQEAIDLYHRFLTEMHRQNIQVIITAGNHDSGNFIASPAPIYRNLNLHVIGLPDPNNEKEIIPVHDKSGKTVAVVCAIPFIKEGSLAEYSAGMSREKFIDLIRDSIALKYKLLFENAKERYPGLPVIATGHLFIQGTEPSEAEHQIHVGNLGSLDAGRLDAGFDYIALGHIHRGQALSDSGHIRYSGSPFPLSFSESNDVKKIVVIDINDEALTWQSIETPVFRRLLRWQDDQSTLIEKIQTHKRTGVLPDIVEITVIRSPEFMTTFQPLMDALNAKSEKDELMIGRYILKNENADNHTSNQEIIAAGHLSPLEMLDKILSHKNLTESEKDELLQTFQNIISNQDEAA